MVNSFESLKSVSTVAPGRRTSLVRGLAWAVPLGICGFFVPYAVLGLETLLRIVLADMTPLERVTDLRRFAGDGAASALVCSLIFASAAVVNFSPRRGIGYVRSLIAMELYAFVAFIAAFLLTISFFSMFPFLDFGNPKEAKNLCAWVFLEHPELAVFPATFLPGVIALTYFLIGASRTASTDGPRSSRSERLTRRKTTLVELLLCVTLIAGCITSLRPVYSQSRAQLLAEGVLLWRAQPVGGARVEFYPVLKGGGLGEPAYPEPRTEPDGRFLVLTFPKWRETNPTVGEFAVTISPAADLAPGHILAEEIDATRPLASPQETPIRVTIAEGRRTDVRIELSDWCSPEDRADRPAHPYEGARSGGATDSPNERDSEP